MNKTNVLFICIHNSARSQMAEAYLNKLGKGMYKTESAGLEPGILNPLVVEIMKEEGIDISGNRTKDVSEFLIPSRNYDYVITVCDESSAEKCPVFPGKTSRLHWSFQDPSQFTGSLEEKIIGIRTVRDAIKKRVEDFILSQHTKE